MFFFFSPLSISIVNVTLEGYMYGENYNLNGCGKVSAKCQAFFVQEACFYECDKNLGKFRKHEDCSDIKHGGRIENGWQIEKMPVKASYCDAWYDACKDDMICAGPTKSYFETPECLATNARNNNTDGCKKFSDVYSNGKDVCEDMWGNSFKYEEDETKAYVMSFEEGTPNPNNLVLSGLDYPPTCTNYAPVNVTHPHVNPDGVRITAEAAGCAADWHMQPGSGHPMSGTAGSVPSGDSEGASTTLSGSAAAAAHLHALAAGGSVGTGREL